MSTSSSVLPAAQLAAEPQVGDDVEVVAQREVLEHRGDPELLRIGGARDLDDRRRRTRSSRQSGAWTPDEHLDERGLAGAVVADERDDLALVHPEVDVGERLAPRRSACRCRAWSARARAARPVRGVQCNDIVMSSSSAIVSIDPTRGPGRQSTRSLRSRPAATHASGSRACRCRRSSRTRRRPPSRGCCRRSPRPGRAASRACPSISSGAVTSSPCSSATATSAASSACGLIALYTVMYWSPVRIRWIAESSASCPVTIGQRLDVRRLERRDRAAGGAVVRGVHPDDRRRRTARSARPPTPAPCRGSSPASRTRRARAARSASITLCAPCGEQRRVAVGGRAVDHQDAAAERRRAPRAPRRTRSPAARRPSRCRTRRSRRGRRRRSAGRTRRPGTPCAFAAATIVTAALRRRPDRARARRRPRRAPTRPAAAASRHPDRRSRTAPGSRRARRCGPRRTGGRRSRSARSSRRGAAARSCRRRPAARSPPADAGAARQSGAADAERDEQP